MKRVGISFAICAFLALAGAAQARPPVVVELFTAQGCSACDKADAYLAGLADQKDVIALTLPVDYWDYLGWKDTFAQPGFADRQRAYAKRLGVDEVYTPQVVIDGRVQAAGVHPEDIDALVKGERRLAVDPPQIRLRDGGRVAVGSGRAIKGGGEVWVIRYDPRQQVVEVKQGDNRGQSVQQRNVVMQMQRLGVWNGRPVLLKLPPAPQDGLRTLVVVQGAKGGRIVGVLQEPAKG